MSILRYFERLARIDQMISFRKTGNSIEFANKLNISRSLLMQDLEVLRSLGGDIAYSRSERTFYHRNTSRFFYGYKGFG